MADFATKQPKPQGSAATTFEAPTSGVPEQCCDNCEPQKLGSESIANFGAPTGVSPGGTRIH